MRARRGGPRLFGSFDPLSSVENLPCPVCAVPLVMSERQGVEIDYCPRCRGVWLDRGELEKIVDRAARELAPPPPPSQSYRPDRPRPASASQSQGRPYPKRRKSFLEELFD